MRLVLPPRTSRKSFNRALAAFEGVVGSEWVRATDSDRESYLDVYAPGDEASHAPSAAVLPASTAEVQALVRLANEHRIPLWPVSHGKNMGYGGAAPRMSGTVVLDLGRMNRICELDADLCYCVVEPGVGFYDLYDAIASRKLPLWMSIPGNAWGSVTGNALERGFAATPYGDHSEQICGLEVVLPDGSVVRTGMGARAGSRIGPLFKHGFGPSWDQMFAQSGLGIVTQMGLWLMPEPEAMTALTVHLPKAEDLGWAVDVIAPLCRQRVIEHNVRISNYIGAAALTSQRREWFEGREALPDAIVERIIRKYDQGWWNPEIRLYGHPAVNDVHESIVRRAFAAHTRAEISVTHWARGDTQGGAPTPRVYPQVVNWYGGRGGHIGFSPVLPARGAEVLEQLARTRRRFEEYGIDYSASFYVGNRHVTNINLMLYNRDDADLTRRIRQLFEALVRDAAAAGYAEYRTHLSDMDLVASTFDFNDHALLALNERVKDALDPKGIVAPGKSGIWPRAYRAKRFTVT